MFRIKFALVFLIFLTLGLGSHFPYLGINPWDIEEPNVDVHINFTIINSPQYQNISAGNITDFNITSLNSSIFDFLDFENATSGLICDWNETFINCTNANIGTNDEVFVSMLVNGSEYGQYNFNLTTLDDLGEINSSSAYFLINDYPVVGPIDVSNNGSISSNNPATITSTITDNTGVDETVFIIFDNSTNYRLLNLRLNDTGSSPTSYDFSMQWNASVFKVTNGTYTTENSTSIMEHYNGEDFYYAWGILNDSEEVYVHFYKSNLSYANMTYADITGPEATVIDGESNLTIISFNGFEDNENETFIGINRSTLSLTTLTANDTHLYVIGVGGIDGYYDDNLNYTFNIVLDTTPPSEPEDLENVSQGSGWVYLNWTNSTDSGSGLQKYLIYRDNVNIGNSTTNYYNDTSLAPNSTYSYKVSAIDNANNEGSESGSVSVTTLEDTIYPNVSIISPIEGANKSKYIDINASVLDDFTLSSVQYWVENTSGNITPWIDMEAGEEGYWNASFNSTSVSDGFYNITINATDSGGNENSSEKVQVLIDNTQPPQVENLASPYQNQTWIYLNWSEVIDSGSGVEKYLIYRNSTPIEMDLIDNATNTFYNDTGLIPGADYIYEVRALDYAGTAGDEDVVNASTLADDSLPNVTLNSPDNDAWVNSKTINFDFTPIDDSGFEYCSLWTNESGWSISNTSYSILVSVSNIITYTFDNDTHYTWAIQCYDLAGNENMTGNRTVKIDLVPPTVSISHTPSNPTTIDSVTISSTASDSGSDIFGITITVTNPIITNTCNTTLCSIGAQTYSAGTHSYYALVYDIAGNVNTSSGYFVVTQYTTGGTGGSGGGGGGGAGGGSSSIGAPLEITKPEQGEIASSPVAFEATIRDVGTCTLKLDGNEIDTITPSMLSAYVYTKEYIIEDGTHDFFLECKEDIFTRSTARNFEVKTPASVETPVEPEIAPVVVSTPGNETNESSIVASMFSLFQGTGESRASREPTGISAFLSSDFAPLILGVITFFGVLGTGLYELKRKDNLPTKEDLKQVFKRKKTRTKTRTEGPSMKKELKREIKEEEKIIRKDEEILERDEKRLDDLRKRLFKIKKD